VNAGTVQQLLRIVTRIELEYYLYIFSYDRKLRGKKEIFCRRRKKRVIFSYEHLRREGSGDLNVSLPRQIEGWWRGTAHTRNRGGKDTNRAEARLKSSLSGKRNDWKEKRGGRI
jgi:hypothetical protein